MPKVDKSMLKENGKLYYMNAISKDESLELAVLMYNIADKNHLFGEAINNMNCVIKLEKRL